MAVCVMNYPDEYANELRSDLVTRGRRGERYKVGVHPSIRVPTRLENLENENGHEKSWNMQYWPKVKEFWYQSWNFTNFAPKFYEICKFFATTEKLSICVESRHFQMFSTKCREWKIEKRDGHEKRKKNHFEFWISEHTQSCTLVFRRYVYNTSKLVAHIPYFSKSI